MGYHNFTCRSLHKGITLTPSDPDEGHLSPRGEKTEPIFIVPLRGTFSDQEPDDLDPQANSKGRAHNELLEWQTQLGKNPRMHFLQHPHQSSKDPRDGFLQPLVHQEGSGKRALGAVGRLAGCRPLQSNLLLQPTVPSVPSCRHLGSRSGQRMHRILGRQQVRKTRSAARHVVANPQLTRLLGCEHMLRGVAALLLPFSSAPRTLPTPLVWKSPHTHTHP